MVALRFGNGWPSIPLHGGLITCGALAWPVPAIGLCGAVSSCQCSSDALQDLRRDGDGDFGLSHSSAALGRCTSASTRAFRGFGRDCDSFLWIFRKRLLGIQPAGLNVAFGFGLGVAFLKATLVVWTVPCEDVRPCAASRAMDLRPVARVSNSRARGRNVWVSVAISVTSKFSGAPALAAELGRARRSGWLLPPSFDGKGACPRSTVVGGAAAGWWRGGGDAGERGPFLPPFNGGVLGTMAPIAAGPLAGVLALP